MSNNRISYAILVAERLAILMGNVGPTLEKVYNKNHAVVSTLYQASRTYHAQQSIPSLQGHTEEQIPESSRSPRR